MTTAADTARLLADIDHAIWLLKKAQKPGGHACRKQGSGIWWDIAYRKRPSEVWSSVGKLVDTGVASGPTSALTTACAR